MSEIIEALFNIDITFKVGKQKAGHTLSLNKSAKLLQNACTDSFQQEDMKVVRSISVKDRNGHVKDIQNLDKQIAGKIRH